MPRNEGDGKKTVDHYWSCYDCKHCQLDNFKVDEERKVDADGTQYLKCKNFFCDIAGAYSLDVPIESNIKDEKPQSVKSRLSERGCNHFEKRVSKKDMFEQLDLFETLHDAGVYESEDDSDEPERTDGD